MQYPKNYLQRAYEKVREKGGVCIADEVCFCKRNRVTSF